MIDFRKVYRVGTRGSKLALTQTKWVIEQLNRQYPEITFDVIVIKTKGDLVLDRPLSEVGGTGVFVKEIEHALLEGEIDLAIHSMKDMPSVMQEGLTISPPPKREDPRDVLIYRKGDELPLRPNAVIGTGSIRRQIQLLQMEPTLRFQAIRGNVDSRLEKLRQSNLDGIILAMAGLKRLGLLEQPDFVESFQIRPFEIEEMLPSPCQGILGIQYRSKETELATILSSISDQDTYEQLIAERAFQKAASGSCHIPIGAFASRNHEMISLEGMLGTTLEAPFVRRTVNIDSNVCLDVNKTLTQLGLELGASVAQEVEQLG